MPSLGSLFATLLPLGGLIGAIIGFAIPAADDRELVKHVVDSAQVGAIFATAAAVVIWAAGKLAGA